MIIPIFDGNQSHKMKKQSLLIFGAMLMLACNQSPKQDDNIVQTEAPVGDTSLTANPAASPKFNIEDFPFSTSDIGDFPFFSLPKGLKAQNKALQKNFDVCFFPVQGQMMPVEGKLYKINVVGDGNEQFSKAYFEKSLKDYLLSIGGVQVYDGEITKEAYERYNKQDPNKGDEGDIGYYNEQIKFYVIRTKDKGNIYVQFSADNASGKLNILQEAALTQSIQKITSDEIVKDLTEKGKSILYINFDVDKSTVSTQAKEVIQAIAGALKQESALKIAIEGHTDNTGDAIHNKKLSNDRATAVMNSLVQDGIDKSRLSAAGFGAERPLVANDSEENKAKNRRVELIKINK